MVNDTSKECFHFTQWQHLETLSTILYIPLMLINVLALVPAAILNFVICLTIYKTPSLKATPSMILISNMALSDLGVAMIAQPIYIAWITMEYTRVEILYCAISIAFGVSSTFLAGVSLLTITISSIDRYLALRLHLRYYTVVTPKGALCMCITLWIFSISIACSWIMLDFLKYSYFVVGFMLLCIPATLSFYGVIFKTLRRHQRQIVAQEKSHAGDEISGNSSSRFQRFRKTLIGSLVVYATFLLCYLPMFSVLVVYAFQGNATRQTVIGIKVTVCVVFMNSAINPMLFLWRVIDLRRACKLTVSKCLTFWPFSQTSQVTPF